MQVKPSPLFQSVLFTKTVILTSCFPLLIGILCDVILCFTDPTNSSFLSHQNPQELLEDQRNPLVLFMRQAKDISYGVYSSFTLFMAVMLIIHMIYYVIQRLNDDSFFSDRNAQSKRMTANLEAPKSKKINSLVLSILGYALAYYAIYFLSSIIIGSHIPKASSLETVQHLELQDDGDLNKEMRIIGGSSRMLEEVQQPLEVKEEFNKRNRKSFPLGKVLASLNLDASSAVFSKDETRLFVSSTSFFGISVVDISNWENPRVIQDLKLISGIQRMQKVSLLLSPDGKALYVSNMQYFGRLGLDDFNSIIYASAVAILQLPENFNGTFETSLALSPDGTIVFASGYGFYAFDVSNQNQLPYTEYKMKIDSNVFPLISLSLDGKSLFYLNGTLDIYKVTDYHDMSGISRFATENTYCSFIQSKDGKILTFIGFERGTNNVVIERVDVSNVTAPVLTKTIPLNIKSFSSSFRLNRSPKETFLYFTVKENSNSAETKMMVFDLLNERLLEDNQNLISKTKSLLFTPNEKRVVALYGEHVTMIQLYQSNTNNRIFSVLKETIAEIPTRGSSKIFKVFSSSNGKFLLNVAEMENASGSRFTFIDISEKSLPVEINSFSADSNVKSLSITSNGKILSVSWKTRIMIYDISDLKSITILGSYDGFDEEHYLFDAVFTSDGKTCFAAALREMKLHSTVTLDLKVLDLSDPASIKEIDSFSHLSLYTLSPNTFLTLSKDEKSLFVVHSNLCVFDVSAKKFNAGSGEIVQIHDNTFVPSSLSFSPNGEILIIKEQTLLSSNLFLFGVSHAGLVLNRNLPKKLSAVTLPKAKVVRDIPVRFSPDGKQAFIEGIHGGLSSLLVFDISNPSSPRFQNPINIEGFNESCVDNFILSDDGEIAYLASDAGNKIYVMNLDTPNTVFLGTENLPLGEKSSTDVMVLKQNRNGDYVPLSSKYKFVKASLFSTKVDPTLYSVESTFTPFPYWMSFEKETGTFAIEPKKQSDLNTYTLYSVFSTQLNLSSFASISNDTVQTRALFGSLISLGYVDNDLYVTGNLGTFDHFFLTIEGSEKIYQILKENYFETFTVFDIVPSLDLRTSKKKLEVQTPSDNSLKIEIFLAPSWENTRVQFLKKQYGPLVPLITENKTKLSMEGSIDDINSALKNLVTDSNVQGIECEGTITIWDHLNPAINKTLKNLTKYFEVNEAPRVGFDVQEQIDSKAIYTGEYFSIDFLNKTFIDKYSESLDFTLTLDNKERSPAPNWLTFSGLGLKGTAPEELFHRKINLLLTVKNEFKTIEVPMTLNIKLSPMFILKQLVKYSPYILTVLGLWVFANRIYNVVKKDKYRHRKDFEIIVDQEITSQDIYPIRFLGQEGAESNLIWKRLLKEKGNKEELNKSNLIEEIKKIVQKIPEKDLPLYKKGSSLSKKLINQLMINHLALWMIDLREEKETKRMYEEEIEDHLMDLVLWDNETGYCQINESKLAQILNRENEEEGMEVGLLPDRVINIDLLKDVILADAMKCQSLRTRALFAHVIIKEEVPRNWIKRFLKKNLYDLQSAQKGQKMAYGIDYEIKNGVLRFSGVAEEMFCGKTIVVQITDLRHKILKEVWIHGVNNKEDHDEYYEIL